MRVKYIIFTLILLFITAQSIFAESDSKSVITEHSTSSKCKVLLEDRQKKLTHKLSLAALIERNIKLQHMKIEEPQIKSKLISNLRKLRNEYILSKAKLKFVTTEIITQGCPGVSL